MEAIPREPPLTASKGQTIWRQPGAGTDRINVGDPARCLEVQLPAHVADVTVEGVVYFARFYASLALGMKR